jgi:hypothetical protein
MWWSESQKKELTAKEVKELPVGTRVHLEGTDRYGEQTQLEGLICDRNGTKKLLYYDRMVPETMEIRTYKGKKWMVKKDA